MKSSILKKLALVTALGLCVLSAKADSQVWVIPPNTITNILPGPTRLLSMTVLATNTVSLQIFDAPKTSFTNIVGAYSNLTQYATNVSQIYTDFFGKPTTNWLTNALVTTTNSVPSFTNNYLQVFNATVASNSTANFTPLNMTIMNGVMVTNGSANTATLSVTYSGN